MRRQCAQGHVAQVSKDATSSLEVSRFALAQRAGNEIALCITACKPCFDIRM